MYNHYLGDPGYLPKDIQRYRAVTPASVKAFAQEQLAPNARVVVHGVPGEPDLGAPVPTPKPAQAAAGHGRRIDQRRRGVAQGAAEGRTEARPLQLPVPASFQLPNGLTVLVNERPGLPIVSANLVVKTGSGANPARQAGARELHGGDARRRARQSRSALQIADEVAQLGGSLTTVIDDGRVAGVGELAEADVSRRCSTLLADVARHPTFPADGNRAAARQPPGAAWCSSARTPNAVAVDGDGRRAVRPGASLRLHRARHRGVEQGDDARRHAEVLDAELRAEQRRAGRVGTDHGRRAPAAGREGVRRLAEGHAGAAVARRAGDDQRRGW